MTFPFCAPLMKTSDNKFKKKCKPMDGRGGGGSDYLKRGLCLNDSARIINHLIAGSLGNALIYLPSVYVMTSLRSVITSTSGK